MTFDSPTRRPLGTMVVYGFREGDLEGDLELARKLRVSVLEVLPHWRILPDPALLRRRIDDAGLTLHSAHGCWGGRSIAATRVDLGSTDPGTRAASVNDIKRCLEWLSEAGGRHLVVHPGGLSTAEEYLTRREALARSLDELARHARGSNQVVCVENMPPGVHPGSRMADLAALVAELNQPEICLALDTGHAHLSGDLTRETCDAGARLVTTHVHDNAGRLDHHLPPGLGTIDWADWAEALAVIDYRGPILLECINHLRQFPETITPDLFDRLDRLGRAT